MNNENEEYEDNERMKMTVMRKWKRKWGMKRKYDNNNMKIMWRERNNEMRKRQMKIIKRWKYEWREI